MSNEEYNARPVRAAIAGGDRFRAPIRHLLTTICYRVIDGAYRVTDVRLDFLQPTTEVQVRFEASVNHRILNSGNHPSRML